MFRKRTEEEIAEATAEAEANAARAVISAIKWSLVAVAVLLGLIIGSCWGYPQYKVWQKGQKGKAELRQAEYNRRIAIREAEAKHQAAKSLAKAEVERARGVAQANKIIGESLRQNEAYLRYLWIMGLQDGSSEVIYIPTEANLPILEATRKTRPKGNR